MDGRENFDNRGEEWFPLKNAILVVKIQDDEGVEDHDKAGSVKKMPTQFDIYVLSLRKRFLTTFNNQIGGFYNKSFYWGDTDSMYIHKKYRESLVDNGYVGKALGLGKNDYGNSGMFYAWFLAPEI